MCAVRSSEVLVPPRHRLVEERKIVGRLHIVAEGLEGPDDDVAVAVPVLYDRIGLQHEPLRPVPALLILLGQHDAQDLLHRRVVAQRQQQLDGALADVAGAPGGARVLLQPVGHGQMDDRVVNHPGQEGIERRHIGMLGGQADVPRDRRPGPRCGLCARFHRRRRVALRQPLGLGGIGHRSDDSEPQRLCRLRQDRDVSPVPSLPIRIEKLVAADRLDGLRRPGHEMVDRLGMPLPPQPVRVRPEAEPLLLVLDLDPARLLELALAQDEVPERQEAAGRPVDRDLDHEGRVLARGDRAHAHGPVLEPIEPAAVGKPHLERRGDRQQPPSPAQVDEHPEPARPRQVVRVARHRKELVEGGVADGELGCQHAVHPAGDRKRRLVRQDRDAALEDGPMPPRDDFFFCLEHDVPVLRSVGHEERKQPPVLSLLVQPLWIKRCDLSPNRAAGPGQGVRPAAGSEPAPRARARPRASPPRGPRSPRAVPGRQRPTPPDGPAPGVRRR